jgi:hypothetical protein
VPRQGVTSLAVSPDEQWVAAGTGPLGRTYVFLAKTGKMAGVFGRMGGGPSILLFSPDSKHLAAFQPGKVEVVHLPDSANPAKPR